MLGYTPRLLGFSEPMGRESTTEQSLGGNAGDWCYLYRAGHRFFKERPDEPS